MSAEQDTAMYDQPDEEEFESYRVMNPASNYISDGEFTKEEAIAKANDMNLAYKPAYQTWVAVQIVQVTS
jgi:hypothetical protein